MTATLRLSDDLVLPIDFVTKTCGILAQRRKGKTYTGSVLAEELVAASQPFVVLDPTGAWWGLRASADGKAEGLPVVIFGGQHGDVPLERHGGRFLAEFVVAEPGYYIIDLSLFESAEADRQFATDFVERLYRVKAQPGMDFPLHVLIDEADKFAPQRSDPGDRRMLGAFETLVRRGGLRGLGSTLISQRAAVINKNVLEQVDMLVILRTVGPNDRKAIDDYVSSHGTPEQRKELMGSLSSLRLGEAWVWEPGADPPLYERVQVRERHTFNSSATPRPGEHRVVPRQMAEVDLDAVKEHMAAVIEKAEAEDPRHLRRRIAELERELAAAERSPQPEQIEVAVPTLPEEWADAAYALAARASEAKKLIDEAMEALVDLVCGADAKPITAPARSIRMPGQLPPVTAEVRSPPAKGTPRGWAEELGPSEPGTAGLAGFRSGARRIVETLARHYPMRVSKAQLGTLAGFKITGGTFGTYFSELRRAGLIHVDGAGLITVTERGLAESGVEYREPMTTDEVLAVWRRALRAGARSMLDVLIDIYPCGVSRAELAAAVNMEPTGGTFGTYVSDLRRNGLAEVSASHIRASESLFLR